MVGWGAEVSAGLLYRRSCVSPGRGERTPYWAAMSFIFDFWLSESCGPFGPFGRGFRGFRIVIWTGRCNVGF